MKKSFRYLALSLMVGMLSIAALAQQTVTITGNIKNSTSKEVVPAVSVTIKGGGAGSFTDEKGNFKLVTTKKLPLTLLITSVGFEQKEIEVTEAGTVIPIEVIPAATLGTEVVISASRVPERILESPVSIERMNLSAIRSTPSTNYYDMLGSIKGVDLVASSLTFKTVSTRGFNGSGNARLNQLVDGMDNQAPGLNFSVGSVIGLSELDVDNMELLPGASSALYGPGGMNGTLLINSKNPFKYQGFSVQVKQGIMHVDKRQRTAAAPFYDWSFRWGKVITPKFAVKLGAQFVHAKDWVANDESNYLSGDASLSQFGGVKNGTRLTDPNYNGVNVYGDETSADLRNLGGNNVLGLVGSGIKAQIATVFGAAPPLVALGNNFVDSVTNSYNGKPLFVSRTGYRENEIVNNNTVNVRLTGGLYYKLTDNVEASLVAYFGTGSTVYTGSDRYSLRDFKMGQYKLEFKGKQWSLRAYTTQENSGDTYNATVTSQLFNEDWKASSAWYPQYTTAFLTTKVTPYLTYLGGVAAGVINPATTPFTGFIDDYTAHNRARDTADKGRPLPGTALFNQTFDKVRKKPIPAGGLFLDRSDLWQVDGTYNFSDKIKFVDILLGANFKKYVLNSQGTIFADYDGPIDINEYGGFLQLGKKLFNDQLKITASGRYDKNQNFAGRFTPRVTAVVTVAKTHNIRLSYQTAYRFPTTQNQWINLLVGGGVRLLGGLPQLRDLYQFKTNPAYTLESFRAAVTSLQAGNPPTTALALLKVAELPEYKAESLRSYEVGYKGLFMKSLLVDAYVYFGTYSNFLGRTNVVQSTNGTPAGLLTARNTYSIASNTSATVKTSGYGISLDWVLPKNFALNANITQDKISDVPVGFVSFFNVPTYRLVLGVANTGFGPAKRLGFSVSMRNQDGFFYESDFRQGQLDGFTTVDGQVSYKLPAARSIIKLGATNLTNQYYQTGFGNPAVGGVYYVSFGYNVF